MGSIETACGLARLLEPATIILEDVDLIGTERHQQTIGANALLFELLNQMDGLGEDADVLFILTTNRPDHLEPALASRPGRIDLAIEVPLPDETCRKRLFDLYGKGLKLELTDLEVWVRRTHGVSAAFIRELLRKAAVLSAEDNGALVDGVGNSYSPTDTWRKPSRNYSLRAACSPRRCSVWIAMGANEMHCENERVPKGQNVMKLQTVASKMYDEDVDCGKLTPHPVHFVNHPLPQGERAFSSPSPLAGEGVLRSKTGEGFFVIFPTKYSPNARVIPISSPMLQCLKLLRFLVLCLSSLCPLSLCDSPCYSAEPLRLTTDGSFKQNLQWSPDGKNLLCTRIHQGKMALWTMPVDGGEMKRLLPNHTEPHFDGHWSPDGKRVAYVYDQLQGTDGHLRINTCAVDGSDDKVLVPHKAFEESPRWSPDGKLVLWVSTRDKNPDLYTVDVDGKNEKRLTTDPAYDLHPAWSPDGKKIAFASGRSGRQKIHLMNADGSEVKKLTDGEFLDAWPTWRPDGKKIAFVSNQAGNYDIWTMNPDGSDLINLTDNPAQDTSPTWSPDGKKLAFVSTRHGGSDIYIIDIK